MNFEKLIEEAREATEKDPYGQIRISNCTPEKLFPDKELREKVINYLNTAPNSRYRLDSYSSCVTRQSPVYQAIGYNHNYKRF